jgi:glutathione S-transferase
VILYDLCSASGVPISPYTMRIRASLDALRLSYEHRLLHLGEIADHFDGQHRTVPVLDDGEISISNSRAIAEYLAEIHDPQSKLFGDPASRHLNEFIVDWIDATVMGQINRMIVLDILRLFRPEDQLYYRRLEERQLGQELEQAHNEREQRLPAFQMSLHPARRAIKNQSFLGGREPSYADFTFHAALQWARVTSDFDLLRDDDRLHKWYGAMELWLRPT